MNRYAFIFSLLICVSCHYFGKDDPSKKDAIARAYDYILYPEDLTGIVPEGASRTDSIAIVKNYIDNWIRHKSVLHKAENNLDEEKKNVQDQLEEYRNSLVTYAYETELIRQKLDTN